MFYGKLLGDKLYEAVMLNLLNRIVVEMKRSLSYIYEKCSQNTRRPIKKGEMEIEKMFNGSSSILLSSKES